MSVSLGPVLRLLLHTLLSLNLGSLISPLLLSRYHVFSSPGVHHPLCWFWVRSFTMANFSLSGSLKNFLIYSG
jgi:hypothetical protein